MTTHSNTPQVRKAALVLIDPDAPVVRRIITLQYNPDTLTRNLEAQSMGDESGARSEVTRLTGPPKETIQLEAEIDAADQMQVATRLSVVTRHGIAPQLAALEALLYPSPRDVLSNDRLARSGSLEIAPMMSPLVLFVWSASRVLPVRLTEFSVTEEAFDTGLNPLRARVTLGLRVLNINDLGLGNRGGELFMRHHRTIGRLASLLRSPSLEEVATP